MALPETSYEIKIGTDLLAQAGSMIKALGSWRQVLLVTNPIVAQWYLAPLRDSLAGAGLFVHEALVPDGEEYKTLSQAGELYEQAARAKLDRGDLVLALGGGVIGDLAGFVAATYLRGVAFTQVPTTLLAQIDSSIGGKVAVNLPAGKNLVGAFYQPRLVLTSLETLRTLPERELRSGLIEMFKHGLLDAAYLGWFEDSLRSLLACDEAALSAGIAGSCRIKAAVVAADEREHGPRALLNLGHTVGHALENVAGYGTWRHGEAVGFGLAIAARLAVRLSWLQEPEAERIAAGVQAVLGPHLPALRAGEKERIVQALYLDKKTLGGRLRFALPQGIGRAAVTDQVGEEMIQEELDAWMSK